MGYVSYESVRHFEPIEIKEGVYPDFEFGLFLDGIIFDRIRNKCEYVTLSEDKSEDIKNISKEDAKIDELSFKENEHGFSKDKFEDMVLQAKEKINAGEIFRSVICLLNAREYTI